MEIRGKVALVTGAGAGIGRESARRLAREGARVVAVDRDATAAAATCRLIEGEGGDATAVTADVTREHDLHAMFNAAVRAFGGLDILHGNAGSTTGLPPWPETPVSGWERTLAVDLWAVIRGAQLAIPLLREHGGGVIVNTASSAGLNGLASDPVYAAAKGGVVLFTRSLASLKEEAGVTVCCICPGAVDTDLVRQAADPEIRALAGRFPMLSPEEVAATVVTLIRDDNAAGKALRVGAGIEPYFV